MYKCTAIKVYIWTTVQWPTVQLYYFTTVQIHTCISVQVYNWTVRTQLASVKVNMCNILLQNKLQNCQQILYSQYPPNWHERVAFQRFFFCWKWSFWWYLWRDFHNPTKMSVPLGWVCHIFWQVCFFPQILM